MTKTIITLKDVLDVTNRIEDKVDKRFDEVSEQIEEIKDSFGERQKEVNTRLGTLETWKTEITTKITMGVAVISMAINLTWQFIQTKFFNRGD